MNIIPNLAKNTKPITKKAPNNMPQQNADTLKGVLLNNYIKKQTSQFDDFDSITNDLLIMQNIQTPQNQETEIRNKSNFDYKKAIKPLLAAAGITIGGLIIISGAVRKFSTTLANKPDLIIPGDLARNINIKEEPHFAMYRALREPNTKNIIGLGAVGLMSAVTLCAKNLVDGISEVWIKKQNCDIEHDLQKNLIDVETKSFSGKLNVINNLLVETKTYFKQDLQQSNCLKKNPFASFCANAKNKNDDDNQKKNNLKFILSGAMATLGIIAFSYGIFKNYQKSVKNLDTFTKKFEDKEIKAKIQAFTQITDKASAIENLCNLFKSINAKDETIIENLNKIKDITSEEISEAVKKIKSAQIYANAPEALGGISEKIQYYCYINEDRGHLYNWVLNPENKFNKYLFISFSAISAIGYIAKTCANAFKTVAVERENSKSELNLKKELVDVEIANFKAKKLSAINPLIENYKLSKNTKTPEELKLMAENILREIKNGPPYVYS